jgi:C4-dicarboxylate transporter
MALCQTLPIAWVRVNFKFAKGITMKKILSLVGLVSVGLVTSANAAFVAPDFTSAIGDMGTAFAGVLTLVVAYLGFKYIKRMFA